MFAFIPFILVPGTIIADLDPYLCVLFKVFPDAEYVHKNSESMKLIGYILRLGLFFCLFFPVILQLFELQMRCIQRIDKVKFVSKIATGEERLYGSAFFKWYRLVQTTDTISNEPWCNSIVILMGNGFCIFLICNVASIKCVNILQKEIYWLMPTVSFACTSLHYFLLPQVVHLRTLSEDML